MKRETFEMDLGMIPVSHPTHISPADFRENLDRAVSVFSYLEDALRKAIVASTFTKTYPESEVEDPFSGRMKTRGWALSEPLPILADMYLKAVEDRQGTPSPETIRLVEDIKRVAKARKKILCPASWHAASRAGETTPFFVSRQKEFVGTSIDVAFLKQVYAHVAELRVAVIENVGMLD
jgi:hypothetical protein